MAFENDAQLKAGARHAIRDAVGRLFLTRGEPTPDRLGSDQNRFLINRISITRVASAGGKSIMVVMRFR